MAKERLYDFLENDEQFYISGWRWISRCNACGNLADWAVEQNGQMVGHAVIVAP
jgi:hypothetical protein